MTEKDEQVSAVSAKNLIRIIDSDGNILPVKGVDDGSGLGKLVVSVG